MHSPKLRRGPVGQAAAKLNGVSDHDTSTNLDLYSNQHFWIGRRVVGEELRVRDELRSRIEQELTTQR